MTYAILIVDYSCSVSLFLSFIGYCIHYEVWFIKQTQAAFLRSDMILVSRPSCLLQYKYYRSLIYCDAKQ